LLAPRLDGLKDEHIKQHCRNMLNAGASPTKVYFTSLGIKGGEKRSRVRKRHGAAVFTIMSDFTSSAVIMTLGCMALQLHLCAKGLACGLFGHICLLSRVCALVYLTTRQR
jgi:membrane-bound ClpP family serine protease